MFLGFWARVSLWRCGGIEKRESIADISHAGNEGREESGLDVIMARGLLVSKKRGAR
jgi:hypothetical protein